MKKTDFSRHTIADLRDWDQAGRLEIQPDFQRKYVWASPAKIMLIDSILEDIPLPKIFIASKIKGGNTHRVVIDGQQRITSILSFINNEFSLTAPYEGTYFDKNFKDLPEPIQNKILSYRLDFNEFENYSDQEMRGIYNRVNKYTSVLSKQELRRADFPGDFLSLSEELSVVEYFDDSRIFTPANRRRMGDVEYVSELLAVIITGPQDKKISLDSYYLDYTKWEDIDKRECKESFIRILSDLQKIFPEGSYPIRSTRFKQKSDFYSFFAAIHSLHKEGYSLHDNLINNLINELNLINGYIAPDGGGVFGEYATRCLSDANSKNSRKWRINFLKNILISAYNPDDTQNERINFFIKLFEAMDVDTYMCQIPHYKCRLCSIEEDFSWDEWTWAFPKGKVFTEDGQAMHKKCLKSQSHDWVYVDEE